jgi:DNA-binding NtrC family response regulator
MTDETSPRVLLFAAPRSADERELLSGELSSLGWTVELVPAGGPVPDGPFRSIIWLEAEGELLALARRSSAAHPGVPVIAIGGEPASGAIWFQRPPSPGVLKVILDELSPRPAAAAQSVRWRRKGDMIIGHSRATQELLRILDRLAPSSAPVLVTGESGTGKELVARALHYSGPRAGAPFIAVNCAAIPESLFEAELFGHQRGAFTGAVAPRAGAFEAAHTGTLFLDEIGEMPLQHQAKLLRALETSEITRLGSTVAKKVNVRVVTATNRDLAAEVAAGRFREDLYYRLRVYPVHLAPIRERPEDVPPIVDHHLAMIASREKRTQHRLSPAALEKLLSHRWPGNVRELVNVLERACLVAPGTVIEAEHLSLPNDAVPTASAQGLPSYRDAKLRFESDYYRQVLRIAGGNISQVAKLAQKTRKEVYDALKRLELDPTTFRAVAGSEAAPPPGLTRPASNG